MIETTKSLVSIILPAHNAADFIDETLKSLSTQTYSHFEVLVVDDCSDDATVDVVNSHAAADPRIRLVELKENSGGPARPRNKGLERAAGDFIAFIDADDLWHPEKLACQLDRMRVLGLNFSSTRLFRFSTSDELPDFKVGVSGKHQNVSFKELLKKNILANSSVMLTSELAKKLHFSEDPIHTAVEDYLAWLSLHQQPNIASARLGERLVYYRVREGSISRSKLQMARKIYRVLDEIEVDGARLGMRKYGYFLTYLWGSLRSEMFS